MSGLLSRILGTRSAAANPAELALEAKYPHAEHEVAARVGLAHTALRDVRREQLTRGTDWELVKGRVCYTDPGLAIVLAALKICDPAQPPPAGAATPAADSAPNTEPEKIAPLRHGDVRELRCVKRCFPNTRMVVADLDGAPQRVQVKDNKHLIAGMVMKCQYQQDNLWVLVQRLPRWRGRW